MLLRSLGLSLALLLAVAPSVLAQDHVLLSELAAELKDDPRAMAAVEAILADMGSRANAGGMLSPEQRARLRAAILHAVRTGDVEDLEHAPALRVGEMNAAAVAAVAANAGAARPAAAGIGQPPASARATREPLGLPVDRSADQTPAQPAPAQPGPLAALGITPRKVPDPDLTARGPDSTRLADVLNRLAVNPVDRPRLIVTVGEREARSPKQLMELLAATGHTITVSDVRVFADFAGLQAGGRDLAAPMWVDTEIPVPGRGRTLKVPTTHSQHELVIRGPQVNVDVSFFMGIDGEAKFRPMLDTRADWTGRRVAHTYEGARAVEAMRLAGEVRRSFEDDRVANPQLPYGGYFTLGVCNDSNAFIEHALTGRTTLYPLTRDLRYYQSDSEIDRISRAMPVDGRGAPADLDRVLASLPAENPNDLVFPGLRDDLAELTFGSDSLEPTDGLEDALERTHSR
jgi:hypothetical protein